MAKGTNPAATADAEPAEEPLDPVSGSQGLRVIPPNQTSPQARAAAALPLWNSGTAEMSWSAANDAPWLSLSPASGTVAAERGGDLRLARKMYTTYLNNTFREDRDVQERLQRILAGAENQ